MPDDLAEKLVRTVERARTQRKTLDAKRTKEVATVRAQFDSRH